LLKAKDVENMMKEDLEFMRNEIFARHGFCFKKKNLRQQFEMQDWYVPNTTDIKGFLTDVEKKNIDLIKRYEKYADEYGDEYGR
jgi:YARHG domain